MQTPEQETQALIEATKQYFTQQEELFGNILYKEEATLEEMKKVETKKTVVSNSRFAELYPDEPWVQSTTIEEQNSSICNCMKCELGATRTKFVYGVGNPNADVMFIGEAPGADEDAQGIPFVGRAGQLLTKIIEAVELKREDVYICNILKCRPPNNRDPQPTEMETCTPYLYKQIELIKPKFIICLGRISAQWLLQTTSTLGGMRKKVHDYHGVQLIVTYHPAALLRNPNWKYDTWDDMKMFKKLYDEMKAKA